MGYEKSNFYLVKEVAKLKEDLQKCKLSFEKVLYAIVDFVLEKDFPSNFDYLDNNYETFKIEHNHNGALEENNFLIDYKNKKVYLKKIEKESK